MKKVLFPVIAIFCVAPAMANDIYTGFFSDLAVSGYDAVAYFTEDKPVKGDKAYSFEYRGAIWWFKNAENLNLFTSTPEKYAPQYGGHCAWAVGENAARAPGDPEQWKIVAGKLYLNYNKKVQQKWLKDIPGFIKQGDENWQVMIAE